MRCPGSTGSSEWRQNFTRRAISRIAFGRRDSVWCSAIEALYTSQSADHRGSLVAQERIKWFLGANSPIYELGDIQSSESRPTTTISDILSDLYELRNCVAHGDKTPDKFFQVARTDFDQNVTLAEMLNEAASRIIRGSLLHIRLLLGPILVYVCVWICLGAFCS